MQSATFLEQFSDDYFFGIGELNSNKHCQKATHLYVFGELTCLIKINDKQNK